MSLSKNLLKCIKIFLDTTGRSENESIYLETGLDEGNSVFDILTNFSFKKIISIEIDKLKIDKANQRFKYENDYSKISFIQGDSAVQLKKIYDQSITIIFLDAHGMYTNTDPTKISPLENEFKFLIDKTNKNQLIIIDDFIKIRNSYLFNHKLDWRSHFKYKNFKELLNHKGFNSLEIFYDNGMNSYLLLTNNKNFKIDIKLFLINKLFQLKTIRFYFIYFKFIIFFYLKKIIIFSTSETFFLKIKKFIRQNKN